MADLIRVIFSIIAFSGLTILSIIIAVNLFDGFIPVISLSIAGAAFSAIIGARIIRG